MIEWFQLLQLTPQVRFLEIPMLVRFQAIEEDKQAFKVQFQMTETTFLL